MSSNGCQRDLSQPLVRTSTIQDACREHGSSGNGTYFVSSRLGVMLGVLLFAGSRNSPKWADLSLQQSSPIEVIRVQTKEQKRSPIETAIESAKETCESGSAGACATAWDEVSGAAAVPLHPTEKLQVKLSTVSNVHSRWRNCLPVQLTRSRQRSPKTLWTSIVMTTQKQTSAGETAYTLQDGHWNFIYQCCNASTCRHGLPWLFQAPVWSLLLHCTVTCRVYED